MSPGNTNNLPLWIGNTRVNQNRALTQTSGTDSIPVLYGGRHYSLLTKDVKEAVEKEIGSARSWVAAAGRCVTVAITSILTLGFGTYYLYKKTEFSDSKKADDFVKTKIGVGNPIDFSKIETELQQKFDIPFVQQKKEDFLNELAGINPGTATYLRTNADSPLQKRAAEITDLRSLEQVLNEWATSVRLSNNFHLKLTKQNLPAIKRLIATLSQNSGNLQPNYGTATTTTTSSPLSPQQPSRKPQQQQGVGGGVRTAGSFATSGNSNQARDAFLSWFKNSLQQYETQQRAIGKPASPLLKSFETDYPKAASMSLDELKKASLTFINSYQEGELDTPTYHFLRDTISDGSWQKPSTGIPVFSSSQSHQSQVPYQSPPPFVPSGGIQQQQLHMTAPQQLVPSWNSLGNARRSKTGEERKAFPEKSLPLDWKDWIGRKNSFNQNVALTKNDYDLLFGSPAEKQAVAIKKAALAANAVDTVGFHGYQEQFIPPTQWVQSEAQACINAQRPLCFYKAKSNPLTSFLSNFCEQPIAYKNLTYKCAEGAFQAQKLEMYPNIDPARKAWYYQAFQNATGEGAFQLSMALQTEAKVSNWNFSAKQWHGGESNLAMWNILSVKFSAEPLKSLLLATGDSYLCERVVEDPLTGSVITERGKPWTDGGDGSGENRLGKFLMELRGQLRPSPIQNEGSMPRPFNFLAGPRQLFLPKVTQPLQVQ